MLRALVPLLALAACVAAPAPEAPVIVGMSNAPVTVDGVTYMVAMGPASFGRVPGQDGVTMVAGRSASVSGTAVPLGQSDGLAAKQAVAAACADSGGRLNDRALGRYDGAGTWVFDGICR